MFLCFLGGASRVKQDDDVCCFFVKVLSCVSSKRHCVRRIGRMPFIIQVELFFGREFDLSIFGHHNILTEEESVSHRSIPSL